jgi:hypothetical protein
VTKNEGLLGEPAFFVTGLRSCGLENLMITPIYLLPQFQFILALDSEIKER